MAQARKKSSLFAQKHPRALCFVYTHRCIPLQIKLGGGGGGAYLKEVRYIIDGVCICVVVVHSDANVVKFISRPVNCFTTLLVITSSFSAAHVYCNPLMWPGFYQIWPPGFCNHSYWHCQSKLDTCNYFPALHVICWWKLGGRQCKQGLPSPRSESSFPAPLGVCGLVHRWEGVC